MKCTATWKSHRELVRAVRMKPADRAPFSVWHCLHTQNTKSQGLISLSQSSHSQSWAHRRMRFADVRSDVGANLSAIVHEQGSRSSLRHCDSRHCNCRVLAVNICCFQQISFLFSVQPKIRVSWLTGQQRPQEPCAQRGSCRRILQHLSRSDEW